MVSLFLSYVRICTSIIIFSFNDKSQMDQPTYYLTSGSNSKYLETNIQQIQNISVFILKRKEKLFHAIHWIRDAGWTIPFFVIKFEYIFHLNWSSCDLMYNFHIVKVLRKYWLKKNVLMVLIPYKSVYV